MKYIVRAIKYFFYFCIFFCLVVGLIYLFNKPADGGIQGMFQEGAFKKIALVFVAIAAVYPKFGFRKRELDLSGTWNDHRDRFERFFKDLGYEKESDDGKVATWRIRSLATRIFRMWEDRITVDYSGDVVTVEGLGRDVMRIAGSLEYFSRRSEDDQ